MKIFYDYLNDMSFLKSLAKQHIKTYFVKITALNWAEEPIGELEGRVISANINIDGQSSVRRTANLTIALDQNINEITNMQNIISLNKKIILEIGYTNTTQEYTDYKTLWFPLGVYVIISCSISESNTGYTAAVQLQDKMCLLNGTAGGTIPAAADLHLIDTIDEDGKWVTSSPTIYQIIQELVNHWGGEQLGRIIISDLDNQVKQAMKWNADMPLYYIESNNQCRYFLTKQAFNSEVKKYEEQEVDYATQIFHKGEDVGYILTDFVYPGELIADIGSHVTDVLDQILEVLGNYEYFYDLDGNFIFQEKKNFLNNAQSYYILEAKNNMNLVPDYIASTYNKLSAYLIDMTSNSYVFDFEDSELITSYSNTPQYGAIKNDFVIWGARSMSDGKEFPLRYHLAIDTEPIIDKNIKYLMYNQKESNLDKYGIWKMLIVTDINSSPLKLTIDGKQNTFGNPWIGNPLPQKPVLNNLGLYYYDNGAIKIAVKENDTWKWKIIEEDPPVITVTDWRTQLLVEGAAAQTQGLATNYYYEQLKTEWPKIYNVAAGRYYEEVVKNPSGINYFLDFINVGESKITQLLVDNIGRRSYVVDKGKNANCVFENWIPDLILVRTGEEEKAKDAQKRGQRFCQISSAIYDKLEIGGVYNSAYEEIRQTLHEFTNYNNTVTIQTIPLYFLEPNTRIRINNPASDIRGDYLINSLSFALDNEGLLTINASQAIERV